MVTRRFPDPPHQPPQPGGQEQISLERRLLNMEREQQAREQQAREQQEQEVSTATTEQPAAVTRRLETIHVVTHYTPSPRYREVNLRQKRRREKEVQESEEDEDDVYRPQPWAAFRDFLLAFLYAQLS
ncbi:hypothetical protein FQN49_005462 [Arthroderma sp. PD_2]|nr:hypothetical protein FQN49_005462 [Arthroderma sp. PD_2]